MDFPEMLLFLSKEAFVWENQSRGYDASFPEKAQDI